MVTFKIKEKLRKSKVILSDIENGLKEVKAIREGKLKPLSTTDLWNK